MQNSCNIIYPSYVNFIWKILFYLLPPNRYEEEQEHKMAEEIAQFESSLAAEREKETERQTKMMDSLAKRKEELLAEAEKRKQVMTWEICSLSPAKTLLVCLLFCLLLEQEDNITSLPIISGETKSAERPRSISRRHPGAVEPARWRSTETG